MKTKIEKIAKKTAENSHKTTVVQRVFNERSTSVKKQKRTRKKTCK